MNQHDHSGRRLSGRKALLPAFALAAAFATTGCGDNIQRGDMTYTEFLNEAAAGKIQEITVAGSQVTIDRHSILSHGATEKMTVILPPQENIREALGDAKVNINAVQTQPSMMSQMLPSLITGGLIIGLLFFMLRKAGGNDKALGFGKSKAKVNAGKKVTFEDVAGIGEAKEDLQEMVDFLKDPKKFTAHGAHIPKGAMLVGPPGTGKTLVARAVAGEANVPFYSISGSDFVEMFVGVGASRVRDLFAQAKKNAPCILFIDEIDAVGRKRGIQHNQGEQEQTLNQLLVEMDGFEGNSGVIILAATNRVDTLDPALLRPGRFDRQIAVGLPDLLSREKILEVHIRGKKMAEGVSLKTVARGTPGFSGAELANLVNEAALFATRKNRPAITRKDFEDARDKVLMGAEHRTLAMSDKEKKLTAYHEAGHAIVAALMRDKGADPIHKATIIPRGKALGMVQQLPEGDRVSMSRQKLKTLLAITAAGRQAEKKVFGYDHETTGASSDIAAMTDYAHKMVTKWGLSDDDELGMLAYGGNETEEAMGRRKEMSEETARRVDAAKRRLVDEGVATAMEILEKHADKFETLAQSLLERETLSGEEIDALLRGETLPPLEADEPALPVLPAPPESVAPVPPPPAP